MCYFKEHNDYNPSKSVPRSIKNCNKCDEIMLLYPTYENIDIINVFIMSINETTEAPNADYHLF